VEGARRRHHCVRPAGHAHADLPRLFEQRHHRRRDVLVDEHLARQPPEALAARQRARRAVRLLRPEERGAEEEAPRRQRHPAVREDAHDAGERAQHLPAAQPAHRLLQVVRRHAGRPGRRPLREAEELAPDRALLLALLLAAARPRRRRRRRALRRREGIRRAPLVAAPRVLGEQAVAVLRRGLAHALLAERGGALAVVPAADALRRAARLLRRDARCCCPPRLAPEQPPHLDWHVVGLRRCGGRRRRLLLLLLVVALRAAVAAAGHRRLPQLEPLGPAAPPAGEAPLHRRQLLLAAGRPLQHARGKHRELPPRRVVHRRAVVPSIPGDVEAVEHAHQRLRPLGHRGVRDALHPPDEVQALRDFFPGRQVRRVGRGQGKLLLLVVLLAVVVLAGGVRLELRAGGPRRSAVRRGVAPPLRGVRQVAAAIAQLRLERARERRLARPVAVRGRDRALRGVPSLPPVPCTAARAEGGQVDPSGGDGGRGLPSPRARGQPEQVDVQRPTARPGGSACRGDRERRHGRGLRERKQRRQRGLGEVEAPVPTHRRHAVREGGGRERRERHRVRVADVRPVAPLRERHRRRLRLRGMARTVVPRRRHEGRARGRERRPQQRQERPLRGGAVRDDGHGRRRRCWARTARGGVRALRHRADGGAVVRDEAVEVVVLLLQRGEVARLRERERAWRRPRLQDRGQRRSSGGEFRLAESAVHFLQRPGAHAVGEAERAPALPVHASERLLEERNKEPRERRRLVRRRLVGLSSGRGRARMDLHTATGGERATPRRLEAPRSAVRGAAVTPRQRLAFW
jgi:hypothetical protein